jgi:5-(carboxyamino)imidazole ribonucleotide mutase
MNKERVIIIIGSASDGELIKKTIEILKHFDIEYDLNVSSAHRTPDRTIELAKSLDEKYSVAIVAAGLSAHLPGVIASNTDIPVIGIPVPAGSLKGIDALLSINQMPSGVPVATMSIGKSGAVNSALFAIRILALNNTELRKKLENYLKIQEEKIIDSEKKLISEID